MTESSWQLRKWVVRKRALRLAASWYAASVSTLPFLWAAWAFVDAFPRNYDRGILRLLAGSLLYVWFAAPVIVAGAVSLLPTLALVPPGLARCPQLDQSLGASVLVSLILACPSTIVPWAFDVGGMRLMLQFLGIHFVASMLPRLVWRPLRPGVFVASLEI